MEKFLIELPLSGEYLTTIRLTTGGLCAMAGFDVDTAEDFKVCVTESLLIVKRNGFLRASVEFNVGETLACTVSGQDKEKADTETLENEISHALLEALLGKVEFTADESGSVEKIAFEA